MNLLTTSASQGVVETLRRSVLVAFLLLALGGRSASAQQPFQKAGDWRPIFRGVDLLELKAEQPRPMRGYAVRIDLRTPGLRFLATPGNGDRPGHTDGLKTSSFLKRYGCQVAINAAPFSPIHKEEGQPQTIEGLTVSEGQVVSPEKGGYPALLLTKENRATIAEPPFRLEGVHNAVAGFGIVLRNGKPGGTSTDTHPRTAAGVSRDGNTLYWLVIDGRQKRYSEGATTREVGEWLAALGAWDGLNLDGGGTTTLVVQDGDGFRVVNRPIHAGVPGLERVAASHLGLFTQPLEPRQPRR